jgi:hypothetical protein
LTNLKVTAGLGLRLIGYFLLKMIMLLIQGIVQKRIVNMKGDRTGDARAVLRGLGEGDLA